MFNFFKRNVQAKDLQFVELDQYSDRERYFYRVKKWYWLTDKEIVVMDMPRFITLDPWPQQVFLDALGQKTIMEYIHFLASKYSGKIPPELARTVINQIGKLLHEKVIALSPEPIILDLEILNPTKLGK